MRCREVIRDGCRTSAYSHLRRGGLNTGESASAVYQGREERGAGDGKVRVSVRLATEARGSVWNLRFIKKKQKKHRHLSKATYPGFVKASLLGGGQYEEGGNMDVTHDENH